MAEKRVRILTVGGHNWQYKQEDWHVEGLLSDLHDVEIEFLKFEMDGKTEYVNKALIVRLGVEEYR